MLIVIGVFDTFSFSLPYKFHVVHGRYQASLMREDVRRLFVGERHGKHTEQNEYARHVWKCMSGVPHSVQPKFKQRMQEATVACASPVLTRKKRVISAIQH